MDVVAGQDNSQVFDMLIERYQRDLLRTCTMILKDAHLAEDAVQETFLLAYQNLPRFRGESSARTWLVRIAVNTCRNMRRRAWFRHEDRRVDLDTLPVSVPGMSETSVALMGEVLRLPQKEREAVWLYYYQEMTAAEVAQSLGVSASAVAKRLSRAREKLRKALGGMDDEPKSRG